MTVLCWYLGFGWASVVLWAAMEYHVVAAKRQAGFYPRVTWREYVVAPLLLFVVWPWFLAMIVREAMRRA